MPRTIIADTSCLIVLANIDELHLLQQVYGQIVITPEIAAEYGTKLPDWIQVVATKDLVRKKLLELQVDNGEASSMTLALEIAGSTVIIDDYRARKIAALLGIKYTGTIGVLIKAKLTGIVSSIKPLIAKIKATDFRISHELEQMALSEAGETSS